jgi:hypothetical protein
MSICFEAAINHRHREGLRAEKQPFYTLAVPAPV